MADIESVLNKPLTTKFLAIISPKMEDLDNCSGPREKLCAAAPPN